MSPSRGLGGSAALPRNVSGGAAAWPLDAHRRLAFATIASLALHAAMFSIPGTPPSGFAHRPAPMRAASLAKVEPVPPKQLVTKRPADSPLLVWLSPQSRAVPQSLKRTETKPEFASDDLTPARAAPPADSGYYAAKDVDVRAAPVGSIEPEDPDLSGTISGSVVLRLEISARGTVDRVVVERAEPNYAFGQGAFAAFERARFTPARKAGLPVPSEIHVELHYGASRSSQATPKR